MHSQMERIKSEAVMDVFQFIKSVRFQRAGLVANQVNIFMRKLLQKSTNSNKFCLRVIFIVLC